MGERSEAEVNVALLKPASPFRFAHSHSSDLDKHNKPDPAQQHRPQHLCQAPAYALPSV